MGVEKPLSLLFIGDSDISQWPADLIPGKGPRFVQAQHQPCFYYTIVKSLVHGQSGATLSQVATMAQNDLSKMNDPDCARLIIACAGENDLGNGLSANAAMEGFHEFLSVVFSSFDDEEEILPFLLFLGPKIEPWMRDDDGDAGKMIQKYSKLSRAMSRCCKTHKNSDRIIFVNCFLFFCTESSLMTPGSALGGKGIADERYFQEDKLHLSYDGYRLWQEKVEEKLFTLLSLGNWGPASTES